VVEEAAAVVRVLGGDDEAGAAQGDEVLERGVEFRLPTLPARTVAVRPLPWARIWRSLRRVGSPSAA
jgi:hypothetical protein